MQIKVPEPNQNIPAAVFKPLADKKWPCRHYHLDKYSIHRALDAQLGKTDSYTLLAYGTAIQEIILSGVVHPDFYELCEEGIIINQYYLNSLEQFLAFTQYEWDAHQQRMTQLLNTPASERLKNRSS
jgi:hypothetical protein